MRSHILRITIIFILIGILLAEIAGFYVWFLHRDQKLEENHKIRLKIVEAKVEREKIKLKDDFEQNKYLASGKDVYERICNKKEQDITTLINRLSEEALPDDWRINVTVEEFTNFILLIQIKSATSKPSVNQIAKYLVPIVRYSDPYLKNIAVFDQYHTCYLYFDENASQKMMTSDIFGSESIRDIEQKGLGFVKFNSIKIDFQQVEGHIFIPAIVGGTHECLMMLDTGASTTVISKELAGKTSYAGEDFSKVQTFSTAKGLMTCPIVNRNISIGAIDKNLSVAININDEINLLGVNFFKDYEYTISSKDSCIYIWNK